MTSFFAMLTDEMWHCLEKALDTGCCRVKPTDVVTKPFEDQSQHVFSTIHQVFAAFPYVKVSPLQPKSFTLEVAREVCELWSENRTKLSSYRKRADAINALAAAAANLYGVVDLYDLTEIYLYYRADEDDVWTREMFEILYIRSFLELDRYKVLDGEVVHYALWDNASKADAIRDSHEEFDPWVPDCEEAFLAYSDDSEFARTAAMEAFIKCQREYEFNPLLLKDLARQISCTLRENFDEEEIFKLLMCVNTQLGGEDPKPLARLLSDVRNTTRTWMNFGHTADEVGKSREVTTAMSSPEELCNAMLSDGECHSSFLADSKPGRNDPCPCGSGKKYKKCCGR